MEEYLSSLIGPKKKEMRRGSVGSRNNDFAATDNSFTEQHALPNLQPIKHTGLSPIITPNKAMGIKVRQMLEESKMKTQVKLAASDTGNLQELKIQEICKIICDG